MSRSTTVGGNSDVSVRRPACVSYRASYGANYRANYGAWFCSAGGPAPANTGFSHCSRVRLPAPHVQLLMGKGAGSRIRDCAFFISCRGRGHTRSEQQARGQRMGNKMKKQQRQRQLREHQQRGVGNDRLDGHGRWETASCETGWGVV
jgi:hypothetical protein